MPDNKPLVIGAAIGDCVHTGGLYAFLQICHDAGYDTVALGPAVSPAHLADSIVKLRPALVAVSYRLTADVLARLLVELRGCLRKRNLDVPGLRFVFGGTPPCADVAVRSRFFSKVFNGTESPEVIRTYLAGGPEGRGERTFADTLATRIAQSFPQPIIRHHYGQPSVADTVNGARRIAEAEILDVLSIGPDQNAQANFFRPGDMKSEWDGAGGVALRKPEDLRAIYAATRAGNFPLCRVYAGTRDLVKWAEMSVETIRNAWGAIPLCWYSVLDGRSDRTIPEAIAENQATMRWYAGRGIPVECNESHQWSLRNAHDTIAVAMHFLAAYNAKKQGVRHYVSQFMFNTPPGTSGVMDLGKMLAKQDLIRDLQDDGFTIYREVRAGIAHMNARPEMAKGQMAASAVLSLQLRPHILHVVGSSEGDHVITDTELIEGCGIARGVIQDTLDGFPNMLDDSFVHERRDELVRESRVLLAAIRDLGSKSADPWCDPVVLDRAIRSGLLDAPHFLGNPHLQGKIVTRCEGGAWRAVDHDDGVILSERERVDRFRVNTEVA
ncbi:MAG: methionine synthase [Planctomycetota bacterium]